MDGSGARERVSDIRLKELPFDFDGRHWALRCNMNVLADVQQEFGGAILPAIDGTATMKSVLAFLAAMLNDCAERSGWPERYTRRELGERLSWEDYKALPVNEIQALVVNAIVPAEVLSEAAPDATEADAKN